MFWWWIIAPRAIISLYDLFLNNSYLTHHVEERKRQCMSTDWKFICESYKTKPNYVVFAYKYLCRTIMAINKFEIVEMMSKKM